MPGPTLVLVTGLPGTGKSTVAEGVGDALGAPVLAWDWFMAALTPFERVQDALRSMDVPERRSVGWALLGQAARAQLRRGLTVVLDGLARDGEIRAARLLAAECEAASMVILTTCEDLERHRSRIEGRNRQIPGWYELTWEQVERTRSSWVRPSDIDLVFDESTTAAEAVRTALLALA